MVNFFRLKRSTVINIVEEALNVKRRGKKLFVHTVNQASSILIFKINHFFTKPFLKSFLKFQLYIQPNFN